MKFRIGDQLVYAFRRIFKASPGGDKKRVSGPAIVILAVVSLIEPISASAGGDFSVGGIMRSYPLSGVATVDAGYGLLLWGTPMTPFSGYIRPKLGGDTAVTYNSLNAALEIYPIAFLGLKGGGEAIQNDRKYSAYDCEQTNCLGRSYRTFFEAELSLGAGAFFAQGRWRRERWTQPDPEAGDFIEPTSGMILRGQGDSQTVVYGILGMNLNPNWAVMGAIRYAESSFHQVSRMPIALVRYKSGAWSAGFGGGVFESTLKKQEFTTQAYVRWEIAPSLAIR